MKTHGMYVYEVSDAFLIIIIILFNIMFSNRNCDVCKVQRRGLMQTSIIRAPDVLILHLKRFGMTARWREKIRTRVVFPFTALDMSPYLAGMSLSILVRYCVSTTS